MRNPFTPLLGLLALGGCGVGTAARPSITFNVEPNVMGFPLSLAVHNDSGDQLCFPQSHLTTENANAVQFKKDGHEPERIGSSEYIDEMPASGPFYFASPHRVTRLPIDTDYLVMPTDKYDFKFELGWFRCNDLDSSRIISTQRLTTALISGRVTYTAIYDDGRAGRFREPD
ncbi:hypothetical protein [Sphingomonas sp. OTU376]|uniref:hypothetical protein n=1 Tax=Sphingomonas sp. OTU376 TaxID=3043863 RepID=UPI00313D288B